MPFRKLRPTSPGTRFQTVQTFEEITTQDPHKPLVEPLKRTGGLLGNGRIAATGRFTEMLRGTFSIALQREYISQS